MRLLHRKWRHHGLGMLQGEITPTLRIHVWHPSLRAAWDYEDPFRPVHDHRFDLHSTVLAGEIVDVPWSVHRSFPVRISAGVKTNTCVWTVVHAKEAARLVDTPIHGNGLTRYVEDVYAIARDPVHYRAGASYAVARGDFHTTRVDELTVTLVHRQNFGPDPARVLGSRAKHGIVAFDPGDELKRWTELLTLAEAATEGIDL